MGSAAAAARGLGRLHAPALEDPAALPLGGTAPDPVVDALLEGVLEAGLLDRARGADAACVVDADTVAREEARRGFVPAVPPSHPVRVHCRLRPERCTERLRRWFPLPGDRRLPLRSRSVTGPRA